MHSVGQGMALDETCRILSRPFPSPATSRAAAAFLDLPDPSATLDRLYRFLVWQRTLRTFLGHLAAAGADLEALTVTAGTFRRTFPAGYRPMWDVDVTEPVTARTLLELYARRRRMLGEPIRLLVQHGCTDFTLLSGRAYEARYPDYDMRAEFDTDAIAPHVGAGTEAAAILENHGYEFDSLRVRRLGPTPDATVEIRRKVEGHLISLGVLIGGYHAYRGPIHEEAALVEFDGGLVRVPRPEHLLVMLAARVERKRKFALVNVNDAAVILSHHGDDLDWDVVVTEARAAQLHLTLATVLEHAAHVVGGAEIPAEVRRGLSAGNRPLLAATRRVARVDMHFGPAAAPDRAVRRLWLLDVARRAVFRTASPGLASRVVRRVQRSLLARQIDAAQAGTTSPVLRLATRVRSRSGAFCEVAPSLAAADGCVSRFGPWHGSVAARHLVEECAAAIEPPQAPHRCRRLLFDLSSRHGT